jgi:hypothetical protein
MATFADLVASRKAWIEEVLKPWCRAAPRLQLRLAELEWQDIAGRVDPEKSLWAWAWSRFPDLIHEELGAIDESLTVTVTLHDGTAFTGHPDARESKQGELVLLGKSAASGRFEQQGPFSLDDIASIKKS